MPTKNNHFLVFSRHNPSEIELREKISHCQSNCELVFLSVLCSAINPEKALPLIGPTANFKTACFARIMV